MNTIKKIYKNFISVLDYIGRRQIATFAASTAFWLFLSIVPMVIFTASVLPYTTISEAEFLAAIRPFLPEAFRSLLQSIVSDVYKSTPALISLSLISTLWSAAVGFSTMFRGLEDIYQQKHRSGYFLRRARGILYTVAMIAAIFLSILLGGFGNAITSLIERQWPETHTLFALLMNFRFLVSIAALTVFFVAIYKWSTGIHPNFVSLLPGAVFSAVGWSVFSWFFSLWVGRGSYGIYGSLTTVVIVMLWLYYSQYILLLGACLNRTMKDISIFHRTEREKID